MKKFMFKSSSKIIVAWYWCILKTLAAGVPERVMVDPNYRVTHLVVNDCEAQNNPLILDISEIFL